MDQEAFEKLSIRQIAKKFSLMDRGSVEISIEKRKEGLDRKEFVDDLSRSCRAWRKQFFKGGKTHKDECNQASNSTKDPINMLSSQNISQQICKAFIDSEHTHTH